MQNQRQRHGKRPVAAEARKKKKILYNIKDNTNEIVIFTLNKLFAFLSA